MGIGVKDREPVQWCLGQGQGLRGPAGISASQVVARPAGAAPISDVVTAPGGENCPIGVPRGSSCMGNPGRGNGYFIQVSEALCLGWPSESYKRHYVNKSGATAVSSDDRIRWRQPAAAACR